MPPNINDLLAQMGGPGPNSPVMPSAPGPMGPPAGAPPMPPPGMPTAPGPMGPPAGAPGSDQSQLASPDQKAELSRLFAGVQGANSKVVSDQLVSRNEISLMKKDLIQKMFELLQQAGVDPGNPAAISSFLNELQTADPDLLEMFNVAFQGLTGQAPAGGPPDLSGGDPNAQPGAMPPGGGMPPGMDPSQMGGPSLMPGAPGQDPGADLTSRFQNLQGMQPSQ